MASMVGRAGALLFSAVFAIGFGLGGYWAGLRPLAQTLQAAWQVRSWVAVPAQVLQADLRQRRGSEGGITYELQARYRYEFDGARYEGTQVGLDAQGGADNLGDWQQQWHRRLQEAQSRKQAITVWVSPAQPSRSLIDPHIRWPLLMVRLPFAFVFTGVGLVAAWAFVWVLLGRGGAAAAQQPPEGRAAQGPSLESGARSSLQGTAATAWFFALFWGGIAFPMAGALWSDRGASGWAKAFMGVFVGVGLMLLCLAAAQTRKVWRYRGSAFTALPHRPLAGRAVAVTLRLPGRAARQDGAQALRLRLAQYRVDESSSGSPERLVEVVAASTSLQPTPEGGLRLSARFELPEDAPTHGAQRSGERVDWRVELQRPDGTLELSYDLQVQADASALAVSAPDRFDRRTAWGQKLPVVPPDRAPAGGDHGTALWPQSVRVHETPDAWQLHFAQTGWRWAAGVALVLLGLEWVLQGRVGMQGLVLPRSPGGLGVMVVLVAFALHAATRRWTLWVQDDGVRVQRCSWLWSSVQSVPGEASQALVHKLLYSAGSGSSEQRYHAVYARHAGWGRVRLTPGLRGADAADMVGRAIAQAWQDRRGRFVPGVLRHTASEHARPAWGWLVVAALLAAALWAPQGALEVGGPRRGAAPARVWAPADAQLLDAQNAGDATALEQALRAGANPNLLADNGSSVLMLAAHRGQMAHVELLLQAGATPDLRQTQKDSERGDTALLRAFYGGHLTVAQRLVQAGASLQVRNRWDWGPVHMAAQSGCVPCLQWLVEQGQALDDPAPASRGETPAMLAAAKGRVEVLQWMHARGLDFARRDQHGKNAQDWAQWRGQAEAERWLARHHLGPQP
ncbi:ankyrin repeat domain-containing protein [Acidovorax kalamii]|uniref:ankyrin repeat domain-containing protein n=1 Tax=Acidovorax kalamii TaxID=2004485 RepID=UPI00209067D3|nr:ankyrin repeat domain-containing protein [Acidovorax kalamii]MCO5355181.1 ankyrin repeat domain-containing protein [Acidovorax kalamii]